MQPQPDLLDELLKYAQPAGLFVGAIFASAVYGLLHRQTTNGDGRTLRKAVDDLAQDMAEHRHETRDQLHEIRDQLVSGQERLASVEGRLVKLETQ